MSPPITPASSRLMVEPEPGAGLRLRHAERTALERREDPFEIVSLDAGTGIDYLELRDRAAVMHDELHAAGLREFQCIRQQVDQNLAQALFIGIDHDGQHRRPLENEVDALGGSLDANMPTSWSRNSLNRTSSRDR
jgi:hypothetical protein